MIIIVTGAGVSKKSGLDTFEDLEKKGIDLRKVLDRKYANNNWSKFEKEYLEFAEKINSVEPNDNHKFIDLMQKKYGSEKIMLATMNVDSLHTKAGSEVFELHGNCKHKNPKLDSIVLYGDLLPESYLKFIDKITDLSYERILFLVIGSSMRTSTIQMIEEELYRFRTFKNCEVSKLTINEDLEKEKFENLCKEWC